MCIIESEYSEYENPLMSRGVVEGFRRFRENERLLENEKAKLRK